MRASKAKSFGQFARTAIVGGLSALSLMTIANSAGWAQTTDPATFHIGTGVGTSCETGSCSQFTSPASIANEVNPFQTTLDVFQQSASSKTLTSPVLLIFGVPNDAGSALNAGSISSPTFFAPISAATGTPITSTFGTTAFGLNGAGFQGDMKSGDVYGFLGGVFAAADNSNSFTNWATADANLAELGQPDITATEFGIYVYALNAVGFGGNDAINVLLNGIPSGTFAVAFGCQDPACAENPNPFATPFTQAGIEGGTMRRVPEPATLLVFGLGLLGLAALGRRWI